MPRKLTGKRRRELSGVDKKNSNHEKRKQRKKVEKSGVKLLKAMEEKRWRKERKFQRDDKRVILVGRN